MKSLWGTAVLGQLPSIFNRLLGSAFGRAVIAAWITVAMFGLIPRAYGDVSDPIATFRSCAGAVVRVELRERTSKTRESHGSGFFVGKDGTILTNYHVVSDLIFGDEQPSLVVVTQENGELAATVRAVDVIHDLALVSVRTVPAQILSFDEVALEQGVQLYSLGFPYELGLTIVPGQFNGVLESQGNRRIHFTGAINPGMSGGPVVLPGCRVIGINVAHRADAEQVGFLVPAQYGKHLMESAPVHAPIVDTLQKQIRDAVQSYVKAQVHSDVPQGMRTATVGDYQVPTGIVPSLECAGTSGVDESGTVRYIHHECHNEDPIYVTEAVSGGNVSLTYTVYSANTLNPFQFYSFLGKTLDSWGGGESGARDELSRYRCKSNHITHNRTHTLTNVCLRRFRKLPGLYELVIASAGLNDTNSSLLSFLRFSGVDRSTSSHLTEKLLNGVEWRR